MMYKNYVNAFLFIVFNCLLTLGCQSQYKGPKRYTASNHGFKGPSFYSGKFKTNGDVPRSDFLNSDFSLIWPVKKTKINQSFAPPKNRKHDGIDLGGRLGTSIYSAHEGVVVYSGNGFNGYGKMVLIEYNAQWATLYAHLNKIEVKEGEKIKQGQFIGEMGRTGRVTGVHLHFELLKNKLPINPIPYLN